MDAAHTHIQFSLSPADNQRLANLCGHQDEHLRQIEQHLKVEIVNRGNAFSVTGLLTDANSAKRILKRLYEETGSAVSLTPSGVFRALQQANHNGHDVLDKENLTIRTLKGLIKPSTPRQHDYLRRILTQRINFGVGPAGTGKTYLAVACAVDALARQEVQRIVLVRPVVEAGERLGFLPGHLEQKVDPYLRPLYDALHEMLGFEKFSRMMEKNIIELAPLAYMRGRTLNESFIILDEAQNTTPEQMKMFLTRIGFGTTAVITGDVTQIDLPSRQPSGLKQVIDILRDVEGITFTYFTHEDVVRHPLVQRIVAAYEAYSSKENNPQK